jgi:hypothetical protein
MVTGGSIISFPECGPRSNPGYRGNCEIFEVLHPRLFTDPTAGGGTSADNRTQRILESLHCTFSYKKHWMPSS